LHANPHPQHPSYRCGNKEHPYLGITKQYAENYVLSYIKLKLQEIDIDKMTEEYVSIYKTRAAIQNTRKLEIVKRLKEIELEEERIAQAISKGADLDAILQQIQQKAQELKSEKQILLKKSREPMYLCPQKKKFQSTLSRLSMP